ncbi:amino acid ABC transporter membrane protein 1, PAAT family [Shimia gijangensis]|uniref:Amino acid ABC transporter membrane protein 1, PAAT family n=1 Tax=Shimia gijangensis TaxID=1470563 RepID=A0A1M6U1C6_9RHOB|nr:ABC transporter permease subunit [Shimia gijangensis]SHK62888.1 amino acid ABC transporter membrane protein 1, PAAT family [Shimia gijangensis]
MTDAVPQTETNRARPKESFDFFHDERVRSVFYQLLTAGTFGWLIWYLISNTAHNLDVRGMKTGFGFLSTSAGFDVDFKLINHTPGVGTYGRIFLLGALNTLFVSFLAILISTGLGFFIGVLRLSNNWLVSKVALAFVEIFRNTPLLIQIVFWYIGVFSLLPAVKKTIDLSLGAEMMLLNNRGLYLATPIMGGLFWLTLVALGAALVVVVMLRRRARKLQERTGQQIKTLVPSLALMFLLPSAVFVLTGMPLSWDMPTLQGFNFAGGTSVPPAFLALLVSLSIYHAAQIAEAVRAGILSVNKGQHEAALSIGLKPGRIMSMVVIPQAMPAVVPPMISQWMNTVKNSSLAVAIGYADIVSLFMQTTLNQIGHAVELVGMTMAFYMFISLSISGLLNIYNKRVQLVER